FWVFPLGSNLIEVPLDDREIPFFLQARSNDHQMLNVQGVVPYSVEDAELLAERVDFALDTATGLFKDQPLETLSGSISQLAQQIALDHVARSPLREVLEEGLDPLRRLIHSGLTEDPGIAELGIKIVATRVSKISPTAEVEKALQLPTREKIHEEADKATFQRRALAVEKERAIAENELQNRIELAKRQELLIEQEGQNKRRKATEDGQARKIAVEAQARDKKLTAAADAEATTVLERARVDAERERMAIYQELRSEALLGLAARELASNLHTIEHLNVSPEMFGPMLNRLMRVGTDHLELKNSEAEG
ncbi:MAG: SPFH domain-containing protein, partial [Planctomycetota bacterium]